MWLENESIILMNNKVPAILEKKYLFDMIAKINDKFVPNTQPNEINLFSKDYGQSTDIVPSSFTWIIY